MGREKSDRQDKHFEEQFKNAVRNGDIVMAKRLVKGGVNVKMKLWYGGTLLHEAVDLCSPQMVQLVLRTGANVNATTKDGTTALHKASRYGNKEMVEILLTAKADVNRQTEDGRTSLHIALWKEKTDIALLLLKSGAAVNHQDQDGWTALHWASKKQMLSMAQTLIQKGAKVNIASKGSRTPLHECLASTTSGTAYLSLLHLLLRNGADPNCRPRNSSCLEMAIRLKTVACDAIRAMVMSGLILRNDPWIKTTKCIRLLENDKDLGNYVNTNRDKVHTLAEICRFHVWKIVNNRHGGRAVLPYIKQLPLPHTLIEYLVFIEEFKDDT